MRNLFFVLILALSFSASAQNNEQQANIPLSKVLHDIETEYGVKFSFNAEFVAEKQVPLLQIDSGLDPILDQLSTELNLVFDKIDERYYILKEKKELSICGYLIDASNDTYISGATVLVNTKNKGSISDAGGYFEIDNLSRSDTLHISFLGYRTLRISANELKQGRCETYRLSPSHYLLNEVVVREYLASGIKKTQDGSITIDPQNLDILSGLSEPDILQNIQLLPGIESPNETASGLYIRGGSPDQNLILWDGIKMYNTDHFFGMISAFNPYITSNVNVSRSGTKSEYGDRVSGVIDITTDTTIPQTIEGGFGLNMTHADAYLKLPLSSKVAVFTSARRSLTDIVQTPVFNNLSEQVFQNSRIIDNQSFFDPEFSTSDELFNFHDLTLKLIADLSKKDRLVISNLITNNKLDYRFQDTQFNSSTVDQLNIQNFGSNLSWKRRWSDQFSSKTQLYYSDYDFDYFGQESYATESDITTKTNRIQEIGGSLQTDLKLNTQLKLSTGYQFFSNRVSYQLQFDEFIQTDDQKSPTHALFTQLNFSQPEKWYVDLGLRGNYYSAHKATFLEPRLYAERMLSEHFRIKASGEIKNQAISQIIEFTTQDFGLENQVWALSSEDGIPILKSDQFSVGFLFTKNDWHVDVDAYHKTIDGLTSITRGFESAEDSFSDGSSTTTGVDLLIKKKIANYTTWVGYTFSNTDFVFDDLNNGRAFTGNNDITHSITWSHSLKVNDFQFSLGWKYRSGIPFSQASGFVNTADETYIEYEAINSQTLPAYHRADFSALYRFQLSKNANAPVGTFGCSLLNLYGRRNHLNTSFGLFAVSDENNETAIELGQIDRFSLRSTPNFVFRLQF